MTKSFRHLAPLHRIAAAACVSAAALHAHATSVAGPHTLTAPGAGYYLNAAGGDDRNPGTAPAAAWRSIARLNQAWLHAGDSVFFSGGQTFEGTLRLTAERSGTTDASITITSFGTGRAVIDAGAGDGLDLDDCSFITIKNVDFHGCGRKEGSDGAGIRIHGTRSVTIDNVAVNGFRLGGVLTAGDQSTRLTRVRAADNGFAGIAAGDGPGQARTTRDLYIGYCTADNNPGDPKNKLNHSGNGILAFGVEGGVIEYCQAGNNGWDMPRTGNGPVGIWGCESDRLVIQHCISHDNKSPGNDGGGFDFDGGVTRSVMQYNLSYHNAGCGYLLCQYPGAHPWKDNVIRYNISFDDGLKNTHAGMGLWLGAGQFSEAAVYNNTIVNAEHAVATDGDVPGITYRNNIFVAAGDMLVGNYDHSRFENNLWWPTGKADFHRDGKSVQATLAEWEKATKQETADGKPLAVLADPRLVVPAEKETLPIDVLKLAEMPYFRLRDGSPAKGGGATIHDNGGADFFGNVLSDRCRPSIGANDPATRPN